MNWHPSFFVNCWPSILGPQIHMAACIFKGGICGCNIPFLIVLIYIGHLAIFVWRPVDSLWFYWVVASQGSTRAYFIPRDSHIAARYERLPIGRRQEGEGEVGAPVMKRRLPSLPVCLPTFDRSIQAGGGLGVAVLCCASALSPMHPDKMHPVVQLRLQPCDDFAILKRLQRHTGAIII